jgi:hypothetical protein
MLFHLTARVAHVEAVGLSLQTRAWALQPDSHAGRGL